LPEIPPGVKKYPSQHHNSLCGNSYLGPDILQGSPYFKAISPDLAEKQYHQKEMPPQDAETPCPSIDSLFGSSEMSYEHHEMPYEHHEMP
jgi:hypothetical protein